MFKLLNAAMLVLLFTACNNDDNMAGGPCTYDEQVEPVMLTRFEKIDSLRYDAIFIFENTASMKWKDSIRYSTHNNGEYMTAEKISADSLVIGNKYQYIIKTISTGSCDPGFERLALKPYSEKIK